MDKILNKRECCISKLIHMYRKSSTASLTWVFLPVSPSMGSKMECTLNRRKILLFLSYQEDKKWFKNFNWYYTFLLTFFDLVFCICIYNIQIKAHDMKPGLAFYHQKKFFFFVFRGIILEDSYLLIYICILFCLCF